MTELASAWHDADDARLLNLVRAGDSDAFGVLQERHEAAVRRLARHLVASPYEVHDVVAETFAWLLSVIRRGGGPSNAVRPYVLTALRRVCDRQLTGQSAWQRTDERLRSEPGEPFAEPSMAGLETALIARAYLSLPERWRAVLWHVQVEQAQPADVALFLGLTRNGVTALDHRATEGLRQAYLQLYLSASRTPECRLVAERLGVFVRDPQALADAAMVSAHLARCYDCRAVCDELTDVGGTLRAVVAPLVLGPAAAAYLFGPAGNGTAATTDNDRLAAQESADGAGRQFGDEGQFGDDGQFGADRPVAAGGLLAAAGLAAGGRAAANAVRRAARRSWRRPRPAHGSAPGRGPATTTMRLAVRGSDRPRSADDPAAGGAPAAGGSHGAGGSPATGTRHAATGSPTAGTSHAAAPSPAGGRGLTAAAGLIAGGRSATTSITQAVQGLWRRPRSRVLTATAGVAIVAAIVLTVALTGNGGTPTSSHGPARPAAVAAPAILPSASPSPSVSPSPSASPAASAPPALAALAASIDTTSGQTFGHGRRLAFQVSNTGSAATGTVTVSISLPAGSSVSGGSGGDGGQTATEYGGSTDSTGLTDFTPGGWNCQPTAGGAVCTHSAIAAGQQADGTLDVSISNSAACGQPVVLTVTSGPASAQATQDLAC